MNKVILTLQDAETAVIDCINRKHPVCLWGFPGIGKSDLVRQVSHRTSMSHIDFRGSLVDPVDMRGLPYKTEKQETAWATPVFFPRDGRGIFFMDELNRSQMMVLNASLQLVRDRRVGEYTLPDEWVVVAACNQEGSRGTVKMPEALYGRFEHLYLEPDLESWCLWAVNAGIEPIVIAFLRYRPELLWQESKDELITPDPRRWEYVSRVVSGNTSSMNILSAHIAGNVGYAAMVEFMAFYSFYKSLPNIDSILLDPSGSPVPTEDKTSELYAVSAALAARANDSNFGRMMTYLDRLPSEEYNIFAVASACKRDKSLQSTPEFIRWAVNHQKWI